MAVKPELSRLAIVDRALDIADSEGIAAITIRRLAGEFGVTPMALYWHVRNKDELLTAMGDRFFDDLSVSSADTWDATLRGTVHVLVDSLRRHPGAAHLAPHRVLQCDPGRDLAEATLSLLRSAGFTVDQASDIAWLAMQTAAMLVSEEVGAEVGVAESERCEVIEAKHRAIAALPVEKYPTLVECAGSLTTTEDKDAYYRFGVDLFVNGAVALLGDRLPTV